MLLSSSKNTQDLDHFKSSSVSQFIKGTLKYLQALLQYLSGIVTSVFIDSIGGSSGHGSWVPSGGGDCAGRDGRASEFPIIFVLYSYDLPSEASQI